jgi:hypothetical protein
MFKSIKSQAEKVTSVSAAKLPSLKTVGLIAGGAVALVGALSLGCVAAAVQSDIGHEILDLF